MTTATATEIPATASGLLAFARSRREAADRRWRYRMTSLGVFEWTSPHGYRFRRDRTGTSPPQLR